WRRYLRGRAGPITPRPARRRRSSIRAVSGRGGAYPLMSIGHRPLGRRQVAHVAVAKRSALPMLVLMLGAAVVMPAGAAAIPVTGPHETVDITTSTTQPDSPAGLTYVATYRNPTHPNADPPALRRLVISLPAGTHIDTSVPARCEASDDELRVLGDAACPPGSRVGSGQATVDIVGLGRMTFNTTPFNAADQQIEPVQSGK